MKVDKGDEDEKRGRVGESVMTDAYLELDDRCGYFDMVLVAKGDASDLLTFQGGLDRRAGRRWQHH